MYKDTMETYWASSPFSGGNAAYLEALYEQYLQAPETLSSEYRAFFEGLFRDGPSLDKEVSHQEVRQYFQALVRKPRDSTTVSSDSHQAAKQWKVQRLVEAFRWHGHLQAKVNPLAQESDEDSSKSLDILSLDFYGLGSEDLETVFEVEAFAGVQELTLSDLYQALLAVYCGSLGAEYKHLASEEERLWIQQRLESRKGFDLSEKRKCLLLERLIISEGLEHYLAAKYPGQTRFSLEGGDALIPLLNETIQQSGALGVKEVVLGMTHRGRINVLINLFCKSFKELLSEFEGKPGAHFLSGDVKYHQGFSSNVITSGGEVHLALAFNPSHLEIVMPMISGSVRARSRRLHDPNYDKVISITLHGDAAFSGQGVVMETLNLSQTRGFRVGGTVHVIVNNQLGFTTSKREDLRSTEYCTDVVKGMLAPIFHVNADDPEMVMWVAQLAVDYRMHFKKDVIIDLVGYRRHGHNEADEPAATQPLLYQKIRQHPTVCKIYSDKLLKQGVIVEEIIEKMKKDNQSALDEGRCVARNIVTLDGRECVEQDMVTSKLEQAIDWLPYFSRDWRQEVTTALTKEKLRMLGDKLVSLPEGFALHPRVQKIMADRKEMFQGLKPLDWGCAETLAYAALLTEGHAIRLTGQDTSRSAFFYRHAVLYSQNTGSSYIPLANLAADQAPFAVIDSPLSEVAVLAYEYGYATVDPTTLVIWEAQFGDFANSAQVVIDQFISSGEQKWGRLCGMVMLLPHGYEGLGPEHSSARLERYLQLCAEHNIQVCVPSSASQIFHLLCRQMLRQIRIPLIVMSPKSLLRREAASSELSQFLTGTFKLVIEDRGGLDPEKVSKVILCSGKVYYDLFDCRQKKELKHIAIIRVEQLYPFPTEALKAVLAEYLNAKEIVWCQEEPKNQGAWYQIQHHIRACIKETQVLSYVGREASASPAVGYHQIHVQQQQDLVEEAIQ